MNKQDLIKLLDLSEHREGGFFRRTYQSDSLIKTDRNPSERFLLTSIFYLLTEDSPVSYFHKNLSDIILYFQLGSPITYLVIDPNGQLEKFTLGPDLTKGHQLQLLVKGGYWKTAILEKGEYGLLSEAVAPGFDYNDSLMGSAEILQPLFPALWSDIKKYVL
jgi:predicted cupin superfamily sugar epimerase